MKQIVELKVDFGCLAFSKLINEIDFSSEALTMTAHLFFLFILELLLKYAWVLLI